MKKVKKKKSEQLYFLYLVASRSEHDIADWVPTEVNTLAYWTTEILVADVKGGKIWSKPKLVLFNFLVDDKVGRIL